jgi:hypothetical protein
MCYARELTRVALFVSVPKAKRNDPRAKLLAPHLPAMTPIQLACRHHTLATRVNDEKVVRELQGRGADSNEEGDAMIAAAKSLCTKMGTTVTDLAVVDTAVRGVHAALEGGAWANHTDSYGWSALMHAARAGHLQLCHLLLEKGAYADGPVATSFKSTPLQRACRNGHVEVSRLLLRYGANPQSRDSPLMRTPMILAAEEGHEALVCMILTECQVRSGREGAVHRSRELQSNAALQHQHTAPSRARVRTYMFLIISPAAYVACLRFCRRALRSTRPAGCYRTPPDAPPPR